VYPGRETCQNGLTRDNLEFSHSDQTSPQGVGFGSASLNHFLSIKETLELQTLEDRPRYGFIEPIKFSAASPSSLVGGEKIGVTEPIGWSLRIKVSQTAGRENLGTAGVVEHPNLDLATHVSPNC
jgi:hypothetical protein